MVLIPLINPDSFIIRKKFNQLLGKNAYLPKLVFPYVWKKCNIKEENVQEECILCKITEPVHPLVSKRYLLCWFSKNMKSYLYSPETGTFYLFGYLDFPEPVESAILDVEVVCTGLNRGIVYIRDLYHWGGNNLDSLVFEERKQIMEFLYYQLRTKELSWTFLACSYFYSINHALQTKNNNIFYKLYQLNV
jgi:hypothetical protein